MARLRANHARELQAVKALCYGGFDSVKLRERVGDRLMRHLGLASYCFGASDPATALPVHSVSVGLDTAAMAAFFGLVLTTPAADYGRWVGAGRRVARLEDLVEDVDADLYMTEVLRPSGLRHEVQVACAGGGWSWGHACLRRRPQDEAFAAHELRFLVATVPHVTAGLRAAASRAALAAAPGEGTGVVVLDANGRVEMANGVAQRLFRQPVSGTRHSFLTAANIVAAQLARTLGDASCGVVPSLSVLDEATRETYHLRAERLLGSDGRDRGLVLIEPARGATASDQVLRLVQLGLTRREIDVTRGLLMGHTNARIAQQLCVSAHTVDDHVRKIFEKLAVSSRHQLAMRLLA